MLADIDKIADSYNSITVFWGLDGVLYKYYKKGSINICVKNEWLNHTGFIFFASVIIPEVGFKLRCTDISRGKFTMFVRHKLESFDPILSETYDLNMILSIPRKDAIRYFYRNIVECLKDYCTPRHYTFKVIIDRYKLQP